MRVLSCAPQLLFKVHQAVPRRTRRSSRPCCVRSRQHERIERFAWRHNRLRLIPALAPCIRQILLPTRVLLEAAPRFSSASDLSDLTKLTSLLARAARRAQADSHHGTTPATHLIQERMRRKSYVYSLHFRVLVDCTTRQLTLTSEGRTRMCGLPG